MEGKAIADNAENVLEELAFEELQSIAQEKADYISEKLNEVEAYVEGIAALTGDIYKNPEDYPDREVALPVPESKELAAQLLWSEKIEDWNPRQVIQKNC